MRFVVDSNVLVGGFDANDGSWAICGPIVERIVRGEITGVNPAIVLAETICALRRRAGESLAREVFAEITSWPSLAWLDMTLETAREACDLGIRTGLRGADAIVLRAAEWLGIPLLTLDREIREKAPPGVRVVDPAELTA